MLSILQYKVRNSALKRHALRLELSPWWLNFHNFSSFVCIGYMKSKTKGYLGIKYISYFQKKISHHKLKNIATVSLEQTPTEEKDIRI